MKNAFFRMEPYSMEDFNEVVQHYHKMIYHIIHSLCIYKQLDHYYSIGLQALWEAQQNFQKEKGAFSTFAYATIRGRLLTELQKEKRQEETFRYGSSHLVESSTDLGYTDLYLQEEILLSYCQSLTKNQQRWVVNTFLYDYSLTDIAHKYSVTKDAVKSWRRDALKKLRHLPYLKVLD